MEYIYKNKTFIKRIVVVSIVFNLLSNKSKNTPTSSGGG